MSHLFPLMPFDAEIVQALNVWVGASLRFDRTLHFLNGSPLIKGVPFVAAIWWLACREQKVAARPPAFLLRAILGLLCALAVARLLQDHGPIHVRPISDPSLGLNAFLDADPNYFKKMNSFPSDHAVIFFALSLAIWSRQTRLGVFAFLWSLLMICLPRIYFGYHYPSDILAGAAVGVLIMAVFLWTPSPTFVRVGVERIGARWPGAQEGLLFGLATEAAVIFEHLRDALTAFGVAG